MVVKKRLRTFGLETIKLIPIAPEPEPVPQELPETRTFFPEPVVFKAFAPIGAPLVPTVLIDIETTGIKPWESRIIAIGAKNLSDPTEPPVIFMEEDEEVMVLKFMEYFRDRGFKKIVGYNVTFDYRFIFSRLLLYRVSSPEFVDASLSDVMQILQQVKEEFVFGKNPAGKLNDWGEFLLGEGKLLSISELLTAWQKRDLELIQSYLLRDLSLTFDLWRLIEFTRGNLPVSPVVKLESESGSSHTDESKSKSTECLKCLQSLTPEEIESGVECPVCGFKP